MYVVDVLHKILFKERLMLPKKESAALSFYTEAYT